MWKIKKIAQMAGLLCLLCPAFVQAQYLSLDKKEALKLSHLIQTDKNVKKVYVVLKHHADDALTRKPDPIDTIVSEGHLANDPKKIITQRCLADMDRIYALAYTYKVEHKPVYLNKCIGYILAWAETNRPIANPINNTKLEPLLEAYDLIKDEMPLSEKQIIDTWLAEVADAEIDNPRMQKKTAFNNWNSHRIKIVGDIAYILNNKAYQTFTDTTIKNQILKNLYADGSGIDFEDRDALHYHIYTLEPLLRIAAVIKRATGVDYFNYTSPSGSSLQKSVDFLVPFVTGVKTHHEYLHTKSNFDKKRADNQEKAYTIGADFQPVTAIDVLSYAAYFKPEYTELVKKLTGSNDPYPNWQTILNSVKR